jgi:hypothetical protein
MHTLTPQIIKEFCNQCDWAYQTWLFRKTLFDDNPYATELRKSDAGAALELLRTITHEYSMLQIMKLHDPEKSGVHYNLSINYILNNGSWSEPLFSKLKEQVARLGGFASHLRLARHKILSHTDLNTILNHSTLGAFPEGKDHQYFEDLIDFANTVHKEICGEPYAFNDLVSTDADDLIRVMVKHIT